MSDDELKLRRLLCFAYSGAHAYMDDGEASDCSMMPCIDFLRDSPEMIERKIWQRAMKKQCQLPPDGWFCTRELGHEGPCAAWPITKE